MCPLASARHARVLAFRAGPLARRALAAQHDAQQVARLLRGTRPLLSHARYHSASSSNLRSLSAGGPRMGFSEKLSNVRQLLVPGAAASAAADERLLQLYWNRAELKKELSRLQDVNRRQLEILKREEGETQRVRDHLEQLEEYLGVPDAASHALLYFQLRALWKLCAGKLTR